MAEHLNITNWALWDTIVVLHMDDEDSQVLYPGYGNSQDDYYFSFSNKNGIFDFISDDSGENWSVVSQELHQHLYEYIFSFENFMNTSNYGGFSVITPKNLTATQSSVS